MAKVKKVYVKDTEGYVTQKLESEVLPDETIITRQEWEKLSGVEYYKKNLGRGGKRPNAGRKKIYTEKVKETYELEKADVVSLKEYARKHKLSKNRAIHEAINLLIQKKA